MGKDLHYLVIKFFQERMKGHDKVENYTQINDSKNIIYRINRTGNLPNLNIHLSDAYIYTLHDYYSKPSIITKGDFILIARPESSFDENSLQIATQDNIGIGKIGKLLGALNRKDIWTYVPKD